MMVALMEDVAHIIHPSRKLYMRDISSWNGVPDIGTLGADIIASKATEGTGYVSPVFQRDWANSKSHGKGRVAYHFFHPSISAIGQARFFLDTVKNAGLEAGDCLALDFEQTDGLDNFAANHAATEFKNAVQNEVKCQLIIYTYINFAEQGNCVGLEHNPLWIADPSSPMGHPRVPHPWTTWEFHQYGVKKGIDEDICNFESFDTFDKWAILPTPPPLQPNQRMLKLTDGHVSKEVLIIVENFVEGFTLDAGTALFTVTEDGLPKSAT